MIKIKKKNFWILMIFLIGIYFSCLYVQTVADYNVLVQEEKVLNEKIQEENQKKSALNKAKKSAGSQETIESLARSDLNYLKENEILFIDGEKTE